MLGRSRQSRHQALRGDVLQLPGRDPVKRGPRGVVQRLHACSEPLMTAQTHTDTVAGQVLEIHELGGGTTENERQTRRPRFDRVAPCF